MNGYCRKDTRSCLRVSAFLQIKELKIAHQKGGRSVYTWLKQPQDKAVTAFGVALVSVGLVQLCVGYYRLVTGKGKMI